MSIPNTPARTPLNCKVAELTEAAGKAVALRYGCTLEEVETIKSALSRRLMPTFASLRAGDGRMIRCFESISDLDGFMADELGGVFFARAVKRACGSAV